MSFKHWCCWYLTNFFDLPLHEALPLKRGGIARDILAFAMGCNWICPLMNMYFGDDTYYEAYLYVVHGESP